MKKKSKKRDLEREVDFLYKWLDLVASYATALGGAVAYEAGVHWAEPFRGKADALKKLYPELTDKWQ